MSIFTVNREQNDQLVEWESPSSQPTRGTLTGGTGLPFYLNQLSQSRYGFNNTRNGLGDWKVPSNKFPTWQVTCEDQFFEVFLIKASENNDTPDGPPILIPTSNFNRTCFESKDILTNQAIICDDRDRDNILDCGSYYFQLSLEDYPDIVSEIFTIWDYSLVQVSVNLISASPIINSPNGDIELSIEFAFDNYINITSATIDGSPIPSNPYLFVSLNTPNLVQQTFDIEIQTSNAGVYKQRFGFTYDNTDPFNATIEKIYR